MKTKKGDFNFEWLLALIAGAAILILAIYGATKLGDTKRYQTDTEIAEKIGIITDPLQAGFSSGSFGKIIFNQETRINNECYSNDFGRHDISVSTQSRVGGEWNLPGSRVPVSKYIFSDSHEQGREFYVFSKPFSMSFKVADLIFLNSQKYCFILSASTGAIENDLLSMKMPNIEVTRADNCSADATRVCFNSQCNISVYGTCFNDCENSFEQGYVEKDGQRLDYVGNLMYAAIFSDKMIYNCNVKRLMFRTSKVAEIYYKKAELMSARDCNSNLQADLTVISGEAKNSTNVEYIYQLAKILDRKKEELCGLY